MLLPSPPRPARARLMGWRLRLTQARGSHQGSRRALLSAGFDKCAATCAPGHRDTALAARAPRSAPAPGPATAALFESLELTKADTRAPASAKCGARAPAVWERRAACPPRRPHSSRAALPPALQSLVWPVGSPYSPGPSACPKVGEGSRSHGAARPGRGSPFPEVSAPRPGTGLCSEHTGFGW